MKKEVIYTDKAPEPGPYSQAIKHGNLIFVAGQTSEDPATNKAIHDSVARQTERILSNIKTILETYRLLRGTSPRIHRLPTTPAHAAVLEDSQYFPRPLQVKADERKYLDGWKSECRTSVSSSKYKKAQDPRPGLAKTVLPRRIWDRLDLRHRAEH